MKRRGRPPYPDILTPREWEVLTLVREGLTNPQIAERLGISFDAAKYHVAEILSKLHLSTREEAAAWEPAPQVQPSRRPAWASALRFLSWPIGLQIAGAAVMAATVAGLGILLYGVLRSDDRSGDHVQATATAAASDAPSGSATVTSTPLPVAGAIPLTLADGIGVPENLALIVETGCTNCDGPSTSLLRVYRDADGSYVSDTLFTPAMVGLGPKTVQTDKGAQEQTPIIASIATMPDASRMVVNITYQYQLGGGTSAPTMLFQSTDGGVTWSDFGSLDIGDFIPPDMIAGQIIVGHADASAAQTSAPSGTPFFPAPHYRLYPSGDAIQTPAGADGYWSPIRLSDDSLGWSTNDGRILTATGDELLRVNGRLAYAQRSFNPAGFIAAIWSLGDSTNNNYLQVVDPSGKSSATYHLPGYVVPGVWADGALPIGNVAPPEPTPQPSGGAFSTTTYPAVISFKDGSVQPIIHPFGDDGYERGRNTIDAVMAGPRVRVVNTGSCLNVRGEASATAAVVECAADGVLLANLGATNDPAWLHVRTPAGNQGYASIDFLHVIAEPPSAD